MNTKLSMLPLLLALAVIVPAPDAYSADRTNPRYYSTTFESSEDPISENGAWNHIGTDWTRVITVDGVAYGTQTGRDDYDDSYAYLSGFAADHSGEGTVYEDPDADLSCSKEVEILLRWADSPNNARGYEALFSINKNRVEIVRWNGPLGDFTHLARSPRGVHSFQTGDVARASVVGTNPATITAYVNDVEILQATDSTWSDGQPGMGFFRRRCGTSQDVGFSAFRAADGDVSSFPPDSFPSSPSNLKVEQQQ